MIVTELKSALGNENNASGCTCSIKDVKCTVVMKNVCLNSGGASDKNSVHIQVVLLSRKAYNLSHRNKCELLHGSLMLHFIM